MSVRTWASLENLLSSLGSSCIWASWGTSKGVYRGYMGVCRAYIVFRVWGFPKLRVPHWGFPIIRIIIYWALGSPYLWKLPFKV